MSQFIFSSLIYSRRLSLAGLIESLTQLAYHFNWRTAKPLGASPPPGCGEPTTDLHMLHEHIAIITNGVDYTFVLETI